MPDVNRMAPDGAPGIAQRIAGSESLVLRDWTMMALVRRFEETVRELKLTGEISGSVHLGIGQESVPVGVVAGIRARDVVFATYRGHGWALACGSSVRRLFAELLGRSDGVNGGRAGSAYLTDPSVGFMGENSIVGAGASHAVGAAMQGTFDGTGRRALAVFGDGALNQGAVHEAINFAAFRKLPVLFVVENNGYSEMTPIKAMVGDDRLYRRADVYGFAGIRVDGNDTAALRRVVDEWMHAEAGPILIEAMTQRIVGHYVGDAETYRAPGEVESLAEIEPIAATRRVLEEGGFGHRLDDILNQVDAAIAGALAEARLSSPASPDDARTHTYV